jgi:hypothetical protein
LVNIYPLIGMKKEILVTVRDNKIIVNVRLR